MEFQNYAAFAWRVVETTSSVVEKTGRHVGFVPYAEATYAQDSTLEFASDIWFNLEEISTMRLVNMAEMRFEMSKVRLPLL